MGKVLSDERSLVDRLHTVSPTGMAEIRKAHELLAAASRFRAPQAAAWLLPLHSSVSAEQQRRVFQVQSREAAADPERALKNRNLWPSGINCSAAALCARLLCCTGSVVLSS